MGRLLQHAALELDAAGLADEHDGRVRLDRLVEPDREQVDVRHAIADRVELELLEDRRNRSPLTGDLHVEDRVAAALAGQRLAQDGRRDGERRGLAPGAVQDAGDLARCGAAHARRRSGRAFGPRAREGRVPWRVPVTSRVVRASALEELVLTLEDGRDRVVAEDVVDRLGQDAAPPRAPRSSRASSADRRGWYRRRRPARAPSASMFCERGRREHGRASRRPARARRRRRRPPPRPRTSVPALSIMSSEMIATLPLTSPISVMTRDSPCAGRSLLMKARSPPSISANFFASLTRPASGETTTSRSCGRP